jgi:hypothetical protein
VRRIGAAPAGGLFRNGTVGRRIFIKFIQEFTTQIHLDI